MQDPMQKLAPPPNPQDHPVPACGGTFTRCAVSGALTDSASEYVLPVAMAAQLAQIDAAAPGADHTVTVQVDTTSRKPATKKD
ncbi:hypothetical protein IGB42_02634 [Andreprevotia sp. IGB-42]|uniref:hypothetical protein n=1 Tax=Andreprevotia sp. IGB-42 TaxID=2497473 RepID=UPI0013586458|nr:hypothetical protein [Andreprevotia sp. IGB-42]KAF0812791.1 hypothetical protein IGB42_02634 [Andreprevotia sp. IGB-42]